MDKDSSRIVAEALYKVGYRQSSRKYNRIALYWNDPLAAWPNKPTDIVEINSISDIPEEIMQALRDIEK